MTTATNTKQNAIVIVREFDAPRDLVWQVWTEKEHIEKWFGPKGFDTRVDHLDLLEGGEMRLVMIGPDGTEYPSKGVFLEIDPPRKLVSTDEFGEGIDKIEALKDLKLPEGMVTTAEFEDLGDRCRLTLTIGHPTEEDRKRHEDMGVVEGWNSSFDKMDEYLAGINKN
ncbi:SRPBCC domain-containing protein [Leptolyngbya sp. 7M]|uniref:SRPBCC domain-containing protein n=1 Tax=Leptolyngbya sp. 7M TaxID=2812896 RepID=UPI001B8CD3D7|nr:SRPBCC domain-containing protein [Leptolyngbya sp. 7M]QYO66806.1 SRPBCC domain-containing protein [Leptolyngbya sp. 7M]